MRQSFQRIGDPSHRVVKPSHLGPTCPTLRQLFQLFHIGILRMVDPSSLQRMIAPSDQQLTHRVVEQYHRLVKIHPAFPSLGHIFATIGQLSQTLPMERTGDPSERWSNNNWRWALSLTTTVCPLTISPPQCVYWHSHRVSTVSHSTTGCPHCICSDNWQPAQVQIRGGVTIHSRFPQNPLKIHSKSTYNSLKIHLKFTQNPPKTHSKLSQGVPPQSTGVLSTQLLSWQPAQVQTIKWVSMLWSTRVKADWKSETFPKGRQSFKCCIPGRLLLDNMMGLPSCR